MKEKFINKIITFLLTFFIFFSNVSSAYAYEWDLQIPSISDDIIIDGNDNIIIDEPSSNVNNTIIINSTPNVNISNSKNETNTNIENINKNNIINNNDIPKNDTPKTIGEKFSETEGKTVTVPIVPIFEPKFLKGGDKTLTLVGGDKGADATVTFKGDESGAKPHALIDYITRENNDPNAVSYCISPFFKGAKENGTTTVKVNNNLSATDKQLLGIALAGYPHNKYNVSGYNELKEEDKYYATLIAIEHLIFQKTGEYKNKQNVKFNGDHWNSTRWYPTRRGDTNAQKIINVAKEIYAKGMANPYDETKGIANINFKDNNKNNGMLKLMGDKYKLTITLTSDVEYSHLLLEFEDPKIKEWATGGNTKIQFYDGVDEKGTRLNWGTHTISGQSYEGILLEKARRKTDNITIVLDRDTANSVVTGNGYTVPYTVKFFGGNIQVAYKTSNIEPSLQDYAVITTGNATAKNKIKWDNLVETTTETTTSTTTTRETPKKEKGGLKMQKQMNL